MVHRYPAAIKAFYMKPDRERPELSLGVDVLAPEGYGEIIGGGERLADLDLLCSGSRNTSCHRKPSSGISTCAAMAASHMAGSAWGSSASSRGSASLEHVRETIPFPRMLYRLYP